MRPESRLAILYGVGAGLLGALIAWSVDIGFRGLGFGLDGLIESHRTNPLVWLADFAPIGLAALGYRMAARPAVTTGQEDADELLGKVRDLRRYRAAFAAQTDGLVLERRGVIEEVNPAAARILGVTVEALVGRSLEQYVPDVRQARSGRQEIRCTAAGEVVAVAWRYPAVDGAGRAIELEVSSSVLTDPLVLYVLRDTTDDRREADRHREVARALVDQRDRAAAQSEARRAFLAGVGHDFRTPLTSMMGYLELLQEQVVEAGLIGAADDVRRLQVSTSLVLALVEKIHDQSMIEAGRLSLYLVPVDVVELIAEVTTQVRGLVAASRSVLEVEVDPEVGPILVDRHRVRQVLLTLLSNACQFTHDGTIGIRGVVRGEGREATAVFLLSDTGSGMEPEQVRTLFEAFEGRVPGRSGLGLAICHDLARLMGGTLTVESELGKGTTFTLVLPRAFDEVKIQRLVRPRSRIGGEGRVLLLSDDRGVRDWLGAELGAHGIPIATAPASESAIEAIDALQPISMVIDLGLLRARVWTELASIASAPGAARLPALLLAQNDGRALVVPVAAVLALPVDRRRLQERAATLGSPDQVVLVVGVRSAVRLLQQVGWKVREATVEEAEGVLASESVGLVLVDLLAQEAQGLAWLLRTTTKLPPVLAYVPAPPTDAEAASATAVVRNQLASSGAPRERGLATLLAALTSPS